MNNAQKHSVFPLSQLESSISYVFKDKRLLELALTHSSFSNEEKAKGRSAESNERLEFLGDAVLSLIVSTYLFSKLSDAPEGDLSKIRSAVVCEKALASFACDIGLGKYLRLGHGEEINKGRERPSILSDAYEALLAAIYLDSGIDEVRAFLLPYVTALADKTIRESSATDYKTKLQQIVQQKPGETLVYDIISESGPPHMRTFVAQARLNESNILGTGSGSSKREAEQNAARDALKFFGFDGE
ncbi:MAG: ribonuclease III [Clostridia bacterium]|nr:ribonuclease III [Clostridia bacterium]